MHHHTSIIRIEGYILFRRGRLIRRSGGFAIFVKDDYDAVAIQPTPDDDRTLELLWVKVLMPNRNVHLSSSIYQTNQLLARLETDVAQLSLEYPDALIIIHSWRSKQIEW